MDLEVCMYGFICVYLCVHAKARLCVCVREGFWAERKRERDRGREKIGCAGWIFNQPTEC